MGPALDDRTFSAIQSIAYRVAGLKLGPHKRPLVMSRLAKRLRHCGCESFAAYVEHVQHGDAADELREMINCLTTNKTDFFREPHHFDFVRTRFVSEMKAREARGGPRTVTIWSAGSSTGEEPYTLAITLKDALGPAWTVRILATDIDTNVLAHGEAGVYDASRVETVPARILDTHFERRGSSYVVRPDVRALVKFRQLNLIDDKWAFRFTFDAIFCRNVTIYFDRPTQEKLYARFAAQLAPHGYFFAGHSENLTWLPHLFTPVGQTIYRGANVRVAAAAPRPAIVAPTRTAPSAEPGSRPPSSVQPTTTISAGDVFASKEPALVRTVLGSCVAACLWDEEVGVGGMNHFMLPDGKAEDMPARYGVYAMDLLVNELMKRGADRRRLRAKVFGGASVMRSGFGTEVATRNVKFMLEYLTIEKIPLVARRVGGTDPLEVRFATDNGRAFVRPVPRMNRDLVEGEGKYLTRLRHEIARASEPEIFVREDS